MDNTYDRLVRSDRDHHIHPFSSPRRVREEGLRRLTVRTEGVYQVDNHGNRYIDAVSGLACVNIGYGREDMADAISQAIRTISFHPVFWECSNPYSAALVEKLNEVTPEYMTHFFFANSGSEANDTAIKLVRWFWKLQGKPEKKEPCHPQFDLPIAGVSHIMAPWSWVHGTHQQDEAFGRQAAQALEDEILRIGADRVGAFIGEPTQATGCGISPPPGYWPEIERICRKHDVLLIADEVVTGFGRSGEWFAQQYFGFEADITVMAKGLSSAYFPVSAVALNRAVAAVKNIEIIQQERLVERIRDELGPALESGLKALESHPLVGEVRGIGLGWAIQLTANKETREFFPPELGVDAMVAAHAYEKGVIIRDLGGDTLGVSPPFVTTDEQLIQILDAIEYGLDAAQRELGGIPDR
jgi:putrescine aminotransferase